MLYVMMENIRISRAQLMITVKLLLKVVMLLDTCPIFFLVKFGLFAVPVSLDSSYRITFKILDNDNKLGSDADVRDICCFCV